MVKLLLSRGADPLRGNSSKGLTPMHHAAGRGSTDMTDLIFAAAPATLNLGAGKGGTTTLGLVMEKDVPLPPGVRERVVGHLLSLGATDKAVPAKKASALVKAVREGNEVSSDDVICFRFL